MSRQFRLSLRAIRREFPNAEIRMSNRIGVDPVDAWTRLMAALEHVERVILIADPSKGLDPNTVFECQLAIAQGATIFYRTPSGELIDLSPSAELAEEQPLAIGA